MATTANYAWPSPASSAAPNVPLDIKALADAADTTVKAIDTRVGVIETGIAVTDRQAAGFGTTSATSYTATLGGGGVPASKVFVAPVNGSVVIFNTVYCFNSGANATFCVPEVRTGSTIGSGTVVLATSDNDALINNTTSGLTFAIFRELTGLIPGSSYNVRQMFKVAAGTGQFNRHALLVGTAL